MGRSPRSRLADVRASARGLMRSLYYLEKEALAPTRPILFQVAEAVAGHYTAGRGRCDLQNLDSLQILFVGPGGPPQNPLFAMGSAGEAVG